MRSNGVRTALAALAALPTGSRTTLTAVLMPGRTTQDDRARVPETVVGEGLARFATTAPGTTGLQPLHSTVA